MWAAMTNVSVPALSCAAQGSAQPSGAGGGWGRAIFERSSDGTLATRPVLYRVGVRVSTSTYSLTYVYKCYTPRNAITPTTGATNSSPRRLVR
eukprot:scaffold103307_cov63-Phaeocystis_antarctica.AAC.4